METKAYNKTFFTMTDFYLVVAYAICATVLGIVRGYRANKELAEAKDKLHTLVTELKHIDYALDVPALERIETRYSKVCKLVSLNREAAQKGYISNKKTEGK